MFAASICAASHVPHSSGKGLAIGCSSHPPFDKPEQQPDGKLRVHRGEPYEFCYLSTVYRGSFSRAGATQAVLAFDPCLDAEHSEGWASSTPGSAVLVENVAGRWTAVSYAANVNIGDVVSFKPCTQIRRSDGRDTLVCRSSFSAPPNGEIDYFFELDFARAEHARTLGVMYAHDTTCVSLKMREYAMDTGLAAVRIAEVTTSDVNRDGTPDVVVEVERAYVKPSAALHAKARALCANVGADARSLMPVAKRARLEFLSTSRGFAPSADSKKALDRWETEAPEGFEGLEGAMPERRSE